MQESVCICATITQITVDMTVYHLAMLNHQQLVV